MPQQKRPFLTSVHTIYLNLGSNPSPLHIFFLSSSPVNLITCVALIILAVPFIPYKSKIMMFTFMYKRKEGMETVVDVWEERPRNRTESVVKANSKKTETEQSSRKRN
ncbi:hypothetical protein RJT34_30365 [Clitoria ternatea]|uniref:Transmembrane protein n=1 Tax=Clitoria ternatea TaxID=43366 RepID=A0AAN9EWV1_CLITE